MNRALTVGVVLLALTGCQAPLDPRAAVAVAESALTAAGELAVTYMQHPLCGAERIPELCADPKVKAKLREAFNTAYNMLAAAQIEADAGRPVSYTALNAAVATLQTLVVSLPRSK